MTGVDQGPQGVIGGFVPNYYPQITSRLRNANLGDFRIPAGSRLPEGHCVEVVIVGFPGHG
jgi:hypothetical protein